MKLMRFISIKSYKGGLRFTRTIMSRLLVIGFGLLVLYLDKSKCDTLQDLNVSEGKFGSLLLFHMEGLRSLKAFTFHSSRVD